NIAATIPPCNSNWWVGQTPIKGGDVGDTNLVDFGRIWAAAFQMCAGGQGGDLQGAKSTNERWANAIGSAAAHEAAHNYGLSHDMGDQPLSPGEDAWQHHLMKGGNSYTWDTRAKRRHFSDYEYSVLAHNIGLAMDTMWNWDFTNPNSGTAPNATKLRMQ